MPREDWYFKKWNPWRPFGTRTAETIFREAIKKLWTEKKAEDYELNIVKGILDRAERWDLEAIKIYLDRVYGKPKQIIENQWDTTLENTKAIDKLNALLDDESTKWKLSKNNKGAR